MRKLVAILFLFLSLKCFSQPVKTNPYLGSPTTLTYVRGWLQIDSGFYSPGNSFQVLNFPYVNLTSDTSFSGTQSQFQFTNSNISLSGLDSVGNGSFLSLNYISGFPYPQFQLSSSWLTDNTQITGTSQLLTISQSLGNIQIPNLPRGEATDSFITYNISTGRIGFGTATRTLTDTATLDFGSTNASSVSDLTISVPGAALNDPCVVGAPNGSVTATACFTCWVNAAGTVTVRFSPKATENPSSGLFRVSVLKY